MSAVETRYRVTGMDCAACATKIETAVSRLPGVERVSVSSTAGTMTVGHAADTAIQLQAVKSQLKRLGYAVFPADRQRVGQGPADADEHDNQADHGHDHADHDHGGGHADEHFDGGGQPWWRTRKGMLTIACGLALVVAYGLGRLFP